MAHFAGNAHWVNPLPRFTYRVCLNPLKCKKYLVLALVEKLAAKSVVISIVWALHRLKNPGNWEMSTLSYTFIGYSVNFAPFFLVDSDNISVALVEFFN